MFYTKLLHILLKKPVRFERFHSEPKVVPPHSQNLFVSFGIWKKHQEILNGAKVYDRLNYPYGNK